jgi:hypothetical protein
MGVTRLNDLPENKAVRAIISARQASQELKGSPQRVSGANIAFFATENPTTHDWVGQLTGAVPSPAFGRARFEISLTSTRAAVPMTDLAMTLFYAPDGVTWEEYTYQRGVIETYTGTGVEIWRTLFLLPGFDYGPGEVKYSLDLYGKINTHIALKFQAIGIDDVSIVVTRVY